MSILTSLFRKISKPKSGDGLRQPEREAILDVLLYCMYADNHLSLAEDEVVKDESERFEWESGTTLNIYIASATDRARSAKADPQAERELLESINQRLESAHAKKTAETLVLRLLRADGETGAERAFFNKIADYLR